MKDKKLTEKLIMTDDACRGFYEEWLLRGLPQLIEHCKQEREAGRKAEQERILEILEKRKAQLEEAIEGQKKLNAKSKTPYPEGIVWVGDWTREVLAVSHMIGLIQEGKVSENRRFSDEKLRS